MDSKSFSDRKNYKSVQDIINGYLKIIPKPRLSKNKIIELQFDKFMQCSQKVVKNRGPPLSLNNRLKKMLRNGTKSTMSQKALPIIKPRNNFQVFLSDLSPHVAKRTNNSKTKNLKGIHSPQSTLTNPAYPKSLSNLNLKNLNLRSKRIIIPSVPIDYASSEQKNQEKMLQVDLSRLSLEGWNGC